MTKVGLKIHHGEMYAATEPPNQQGFPDDTGYLNRETGKIVFITQERAADAIEAVNRARIENDRPKWLKIERATWFPGYDPHTDHDEYIREFLEKNGIEAVWQE